MCTQHGLACIDNIATKMVDSFHQKLPKLKIVTSVTAKMAAVQKWHQRRLVLCITQFGVHRCKKWSFREVTKCVLCKRVYISNLAWTLLSIHVLSLHWVFNHLSCSQMRQDNHLSAVCGISQSSTAYSQLSSAYWDVWFLGWTAPCQTSWRRTSKVTANIIHSFGERGLSWYF